jgi:hypothetical protein
MGTACGGAQQAPTIGTDDGARTGTPEGWPQVLVSGPGDGPALFLGPESDSPAIGYVSPGVRARLDGPPQNGRVPVTLSSGLAARGWMPLSRLGGYVTTRGRVDGTPTYVGVGDFVAIEARRDDGRFDVLIAPDFGRGEQDRVGPWTGTIEADGFSAQAPTGPDTGLNPGENRKLPTDLPTQVYDRPDGRVIATIPASNPPATVVVLRNRDGWNGVRAGVGPYLVGYVRGELAPADGPPVATWTRPTAPEGQMPIRVAEEEGTLVRVRDGARVRFLDRVVARLRGQGWARRLGSVEGGLLDVYIAVDDAVAIRGLIRAEDASETESAAPTAAQDGEGL